MDVYCGECRLKMENIGMSEGNWYEELVAKPLYYCNGCDKRIIISQTGGK